LFRYLFCIPVFPSSDHRRSERTAPPPRAKARFRFRDPKLKRRAKETRRRAGPEYRSALQWARAAGAAEYEDDDDSESDLNTHEDDEADVDQNADQNVDQNADRFGAEPSASVINVADIEMGHLSAEAAPRTVPTSHAANTSSSSSSAAMASLVRSLSTLASRVPSAVALSAADRRLLFETHTHASAAEIDAIAARGLQSDVAVTAAASSLSGTVSSEAAAFSADDSHQRSRRRDSMTRRHASHAADVPDNGRMGHEHAYDDSYGANMNGTDGDDDHAAALARSAPQHTLYDASLAFATAAYATHNTLYRSARSSPHHQSTRSNRDGREYRRYGTDTDHQSGAETAGHLASAEADDDALLTPTERTIRLRAQRAAAANAGGLFGAHAAAGSSASAAAASSGRRRASMSATAGNIDIGETASQRAARATAHETAVSAVRAREQREQAALLRRVGVVDAAKLPRTQVRGFAHVDFLSFH
jgi:hypothetical protein